jgi:hypothetical protein
VLGDVEGEVEAANREDRDYRVRPVRIVGELLEERGGEAEAFLFTAVRRCLGGERPSQGQDEQGESKSRDAQVSGTLGAQDDVPSLLMSVLGWPRPRRGARPPVVPPAHSTFCKYRATYFLGTKQ